MKRLPDVSNEKDTYLTNLNKATLLEKGVSFSQNTESQLLYEMIRSTTITRYVSRDPDKENIRWCLGHQVFNKLQYGAPYCRFLLMSETFEDCSIIKKIHGLINRDILLKILAEDQELNSAIHFFYHKGGNSLLNISWMLPWLIENKGYRTSKVIYFYEIGENTNDWVLSELSECLKSEAFNTTSLSYEYAMESKEFELFSKIMKTPISWRDFYVTRYIHFSEYVNNNCNTYYQYERIGNKTYLDLKVHSTVFSALKPIPDGIDLSSSHEKLILTLIMRGIPMYPKFAICEDSNSELIYAQREIAETLRDQVTLKVSTITGITTVLYCKKIFDQELDIIDPSLSLGVNNIKMKNHISFNYIPTMSDYQTKHLECNVKTLGKTINPIMISEIIPNKFQNSKPIWHHFNPDRIKLYKPQLITVLYKNPIKNRTFMDIKRNKILYEGILKEVATRCHSIENNYSISYMSLAVQ